MRVSDHSNTVLAERGNVSIATARKWKGRADSQDRSHRPRVLFATLSAAQEMLVVELRRVLRPGSKGSMAKTSQSRTGRAPAMAVCLRSTVASMASHRSASSIVVSCSFSPMTVTMG
jgi:hypothetical protein